MTNRCENPNQTCINDFRWYSFSLFQCFSSNPICGKGKSSQTKLTAGGCKFGVQDSISIYLEIDNIIISAGIVLKCYIAIQGFLFY
jgi:hypothetical protein